MSNSATHPADNNSTHCNDNRGSSEAIQQYILVSVPKLNLGLISARPQRKCLLTPFLDEHETRLHCCC